MTGAGASIVVRIYGPDLEGLRAKAAEVGKTIERRQGVANLKVEQQVLVPQIEVRLKPDAAARFGLTPGDVRRAATTLIKGQKVGELYEEQQINDVVVWGAPNTRTELKPCAGCASAYPPEATRRWATWPTCGSRPRRT